MDSARYLVGVLYAAILVFLTVYLFSAKRISKIWIFPMGLFPVAAVYALNPGFRIHSFHGFLQASIVYQILNGNIPPANPFLAGEELWYPWGYHCLVALASWTFRITPFSSAALINILLLGIGIVAVYKISQLLIREEKANVLSSVFALFGTAVFGYSAGDSHFLQKLQIPAGFSELRGIPALEKFSNFTGTPTGLIFFLFFLYSALRLFRGGNPKRYGPLLFLAIIGCGFFYAPLLLAIIASSAAISLVALVRKRHFPCAVARTALLMLVLATALGVLSPYLLSIGSGLRTNIELVDVRHLAGRVVAVLIIALPVLGIITAKRTFLRDALDMPVAVLVVSVCLANLICFLLLSMPLGVQYKCLMLSTATLGILGGIAFYGITRTWNRVIVLVLLLLFLWPSYRNVEMKLVFQRNAPDVIERGRLVYSGDTEQDELNRWIRQETPQDGIFIDSSLALPVFAQRQLLIGVDEGIPQVGYGFSIDTFLRTVFGYDEILLNERSSILGRIYDQDSKLPIEVVSYLRSFRNGIYIVTRSAPGAEKLDRSGLTRVFQSAGGRLSVYQAGAVTRLQ